MTTPKQFVQLDQSVHTALKVSAALRKQTMSQRVEELLANEELVA